MEPNLTVTKTDVARIIAEWWRQYEENPQAFQPGPDTDGESSADMFFRIAKELRIQ